MSISGTVIAPLFYQVAIMGSETILRCLTTLNTFDVLDPLIAVDGFISSPFLGGQGCRSLAPSPIDFS